MALISALRQAIENMPDSMKVESIGNYFRKQGVKEVEIANSKILDDAAHSWQNPELNAKYQPQNGRLTREQLLGRENMRDDVTHIADYGQSYINYTVGSTNPNTYKARVYKNQYISGGKNSHHFNESQNYFMHTRSDIVRDDWIETNIPASMANDPEYARYRESLEASYVKPSFGDKALRIQEVQSDLANYAQRESRNREFLGSETFGHLLGQAANRATHNPNLNLSQEAVQQRYSSWLNDPGYEPARLEYLTKDLGLTEDAARKALADYAAGNEIRLYNDVSAAMKDMPLDYFEAGLEDYLQELAEETDMGYGDALEVIMNQSDEFYDYARNKLGLSQQQADDLSELYLSLDPDVLSTARIDFSNRVNNPLCVNLGNRNFLVTTSLHFRSSAEQQVFIATQVFTNYFSHCLSPRRA